MSQTTLRLLLAFGCVAGLSAQQLPSPAPAPAPATAPQGPPVTFRTEINLVEVDATVTDAKGNPVMDLTQADFEILEDGKPQQIANFSVVNIPIVRDDRPVVTAEPIERDVQTNERADGRLYLIVLDNWHTEPLNALRVKQSARAFIERRFGTNDLAAVVHTNGRSDWGQDFTSNRRLLMASIDRFIGEKVQSATMARLDAFNTGRPLMTGPGNPVNSRDRGMGDPLEMERGDRARRTLRALQNLSNYMAGIHGRRKSLIFISEGLSYDLADPWSAVDASIIADSVRDAVGAATRANVSIFAVDPRGLGTGTELGIEMNGVPGSNATDITGQSVDTRGMGLSSLMTEARLGQISLQTIAEQTGGFAAINRNDFKDVFERIVKENSAYYVLAYYPPSTKRDGKFHKITVRVKRPGLQVRSRKGYAAPRGKAPTEKPLPANASSPEMRAAMNSPVPVAGLPMRVFAGAFKGTAPNASVAIAVEVQASNFKYTDKGGLASNVLEVSFTPIDAGGNVKPGKKSRATLSFKPEALAAANAFGVRVLSAVDMPPGRYQIRVAASEEGGGQTGSVLYDLEIPDFFKAPLTMSGVAVTSLAAQQVVTVGSEGMIAPLVVGPTTATRDFSKSDTLALFTEVYENAPGSSPHTIDLSVTLRSSDGRVVFEAKEQRSSTELQAGRGGYGYTPQIPLKDVQPGTYLLHVEAKSRAGKEPMGVGRDIEIRVRP
ncbi:MAG: VWA domain-containing protein [Vicinamibacterales bacterium]